jgi:hypothetical protein
LRVLVASEFDEVWKWIVVYVCGVFGEVWVGSKITGSLQGEEKKEMELYIVCEGVFSVGRSVVDAVWKPFYFLLKKQTHTHKRTTTQRNGR